MKLFDFLLYFICRVIIVTDRRPVKTDVYGEKAIGPFPEKLNLPEEVHRRNQRLIDYCNLRIKLYGLLYQSAAENSSDYKDSINFYNLSIEKVIRSFKSPTK